MKPWISEVANFENTGWLAGRKGKTKMQLYLQPSIEEAG